MNSNVLNAYSILNAEQLRWPTTIYRVSPTESSIICSRSQVKEAAWNAKRANPSLFKGIGYIIDLDAHRIAVPSSWTIPEDIEQDGYVFKQLEQVEINGSDERFTSIFSRILKEALKSHLKKHAHRVLGPLWSDYGTLCQVPSNPNENGFAFCRKFDFDPKPIAQNEWAIRVAVSTVSVDAYPIARYYENAAVEELAERIHSKLANKGRRDDKTIAIRILHAPSNFEVKAFELSDPVQLLDDGKLNAFDQKQRAKIQLSCVDFPNKLMMLSKEHCYLILDGKITQDDHDSTILSAAERFEWAEKMREVSNGCIAFGIPIQIATQPLSADRFLGSVLPPPAIYVKGKEDFTIIESADTPDIESLKERAKDRDFYLKRYGFYEERPISPILAIPNNFSKTSGGVLHEIVNDLCAEKNISYRFPEPYYYNGVGDLITVIEQQKHDTLLAVLPESKHHHYRENDTHEQIKKRIAIPSQCIFHDNAFPTGAKGHNYKTLHENLPKVARRMRSQLDLCLINLLVKAQWFPFIPAEKANYNIHIGLDVGGKYNNRIVASIGYGFANPFSGLWFKTIEISLNQQKAEPVPPDQLFHGLLQLFEETYSAISAIGDRPQLDRVLFFRDGPLLGAGENWNEIEALHRLALEISRRGWIHGDQAWAAVEIHKNAEGWRVFNVFDTVENPTVGYCCFPFRSLNEGLLCTTGRPYLHQGTAQPLKFCVKDIVGKSDSLAIARDIVWDADMCFTKPDMGQSLPWTLQIADSGALQLSKSYRISGIPV